MKKYIRRKLIIDQKNKREKNNYYNVDNVRKGTPNRNLCKSRSTNV